MPGTEEIVMQIRAAEDRRYAAMTAADTGALAELLSDRLVYSHSNAARDGKESLLSKISGKLLVYTTIEHPVHQVIVLGDAVLVTGEMRGDVLVGGLPRRLDNSVLAVWAREDGGWKLAAFQPTPLPR